ncbi:MAG: ATP-binding protein [Bacteroidota bacterium]
MDTPKQIIARKEEITTLRELYRKRSSELVSITGRRRVGKTFLVDTLFAGKIDFKLVGVQNGSREVQLNNFGRVMARLRGTSIREATPTSWQFAFFALEDYLRSLDKSEKLVLFFDELPWIATPKSGFLQSLGHFWNSWAERENILIIICGSAASWMINKVVRHKGGLHNRLTRRIHLAPFTLLETQRYLEEKGFDLSRYDIAELYMIMGGIPYYLEALDRNLSVAQNVDRLALTANGVLHDEFNRLYPALFDKAERHTEIVRALAKHHYGLDRQQIIKSTSLSDGGGLSSTLDELEFSGFIHGYYLFDKKKRYKRYRLIDEYSNFYLKFVETNKEEGQNIWERLSTTPAYRSWTGYAFENLGLRHLAQIRKALGIAGVSTKTSTFYHPGNEFARGVQIDLLIERADRAINLCEFKFYRSVVSLTKEQIQNLRERKQAFRQLTQTDFTLFTSLVSPYGINPASNKGGIVNQSVTLDDLFS